MGTSPRIVLVAAAAENDVIGRDGGMPWHLPDDLRHFKSITVGKPVVMGRRTWDQLGGSPLPDRRNIVLTRDTSFASPGATVVHSVEDAIAQALEGGSSEVMIIGGGEVYRLFMAKADCIELTRVHAIVDGDVTFPSIGEEWTCRTRDLHEADDRHAHSFTFEQWART